MKNTILISVTAIALVLVLLCMALYLCVPKEHIPAFDQANQTQKQEFPTVAVQNTPTEKPEPKNDETKPSTTATQPESEPVGDIGKEAALQIALDHAGLTKADVQELEVEFDRERGNDHYDVEFRHKATEYEYEIDPITGKILKAEIER